MEIVLATRNRDKIREIKNKIKDLKFKIYTLDDFKGFPKVREDGRTLEENAVKKARIIAGFTGKTAIADDTGLEVPAIGNRPGVYSSRFAGYGCSYEDNNRKLLRLMKNHKGSKRKAVFKCVIAIVKPDGKSLTALGICRGRINSEIAGKNGFGYDPVFIPDSYKKSFAEMNISFKNRISHRGKALSKAKQLLKKILSNPE